MAIVEQSPPLDGLPLDDLDQIDLGQIYDLHNDLVSLYNLAGMNRLPGWDADYLGDLACYRRTLEDSEDKTTTRVTIKLGSLAGQENFALLALKKERETECGGHTSILNYYVSRDAGELNGSGIKVSRIQNKRSVESVSRRIEDHRDIIGFIAGLRQLYVAALGY